MVLTISEPCLVELLDDHVKHNVSPSRFVSPPSHHLSISFYSLCFRKLDDDFCPMFPKLVLKDLSKLFEHIVSKKFGIKDRQFSFTHWDISTFRYLLFVVVRKLSQLNRHTFTSYDASENFFETDLIGLTIPVLYLSLIHTLRLTPSTVSYFLCFPFSIFLSLYSILSIYLCLSVCLTHSLTYPPTHLLTLSLTH